MHVEDGFSLLKVGKFDIDLPVETSGTQEGFVQHIGTVGGGQHDDVGTTAETIHLGKQLVKGILAFVVGVAQSGMAARTSHSINLVDKDDAGRFLLGLLEEVSHTRSTHAHKHLDKIGTRHGEEWHIGLTGHSLCQECLTRARRPYQQHPLGNLTTQIGILFRMLQEVHHLHHLLLGASQSGHILEGDIRGGLSVVHFRLALPYSEDTATTAHLALGYTAHYHEEENQD